MTQYSGVYVVIFENTSISTARTMCQVNAASGRPLEVIRAWVTFNSTTSTAIEVAIKTVSTAGTGTSFTARTIRDGGQSFGGTMTTNHTAEGTLTDRKIREFVNHLQGFMYLPVPEERIRITGGGRVALELPTAPGAGVNVSAGMVIGTL